jgi:nucleotide-binding universal stress UspA family protein
MHSILAATDFSAHARHAADRAARLAHETGAALTLMHVLPGETLAQLRRWLGAGHAAEQSLLDDARGRLQALAHELHTARRVPVTPVDASGPVLDEILQRADVIDASLLVLGARGMGFLRRLVLGSTAERLMRRTTRPLLAVRQMAHEPYRRVLVALDFSPWSAEALAVARQVAPHARLSLVSVFQVPFEEKLRFAGVDEATVAHYRAQARAEASRGMQALAQAAGLRAGQWDECVVEGDASLRIVELEQELDADLVVLGKHGLSAGVDLLLGSVTRHVLSEGSVDVLVSTRRRG